VRTTPGTKWMITQRNVAYCVKDDDSITHAYTSHPTSACERNACRSYIVPSGGIAHDASTCGRIQRLN
jgi:hypothetical protein